MVLGSEWIFKLSVILKAFYKIVISQLQHLWSSTYYFIIPVRVHKRRFATTYLFELTSVAVNGFRKEWKFDVIYTEHYCFDSPGSHLGPPLLTIFINDLTPILSYSRVLMYADDAYIKMIPVIYYKPTCRRASTFLLGLKCKVMTL